MPQDPYAAIAKPVDDPYAAIAKPVSGAGGSYDMPKPDGAIMANAKSFFGDLWDSVKHTPELFDAPRNDEEKAIHRISGGNGAHLVLYRLTKGYMGAVQENVKRAELAADKGDNAGVVINSAAAGLPIVGPLIGGLYEDSQANNPGMIGKGLSRVVQAASMAPEGSRIPNPATGVVNAGVKVINKAAPLAQDVASGLYQSALKPSLAKNAPNPKAIVQTGLENKIPISEGGIVKLGTLIDDLNTKISDVVNSRPGAKIDPNKVATRADQIKGPFRNQVNAGEDLATIESSKQQFLSEQGAKPGQPAKPPQPTGVLDANGNPIMNAGTPAKPATPAPPMDAAKAQAMKVGTYQSLGKKAYGELKGASVEAQKSLARGIKEELVNTFPELKGLNAQESKLFDLGPALEHAVNRIGNHQVVGIGTPAVAAGTEAITKSAGLAGTAATLKAVLDNPWVKSKLAIALSRAGKISPAAAKTRVAAYVNALAQTAAADNSEVPAAEANQE